MALPALLLALVFFTIGRKEISWLQRVIGFATLQEIAHANMQEFNLHNVHTDLFENLYYVGAFAFLRDALPALRCAFAGIIDYLPSRWVAAVAAPLSIFNYGMWNVIPMQMTMMLTLLEWPSTPTPPQAAARVGRRRSSRRSRWPSSPVRLPCLPERNASKHLGPIRIQGTLHRHRPLRRRRGSGAKGAQQCR